MLKSKVMLAVSLTGAVFIAFLVWQLSATAEARDEARKEATEAQQALQLMKEQAARHREESQRLETILVERREREARDASILADIKGEIHALRGDCILSDDATRMLRQIYERTIRLQRRDADGDLSSDGDSDSGTASG